MQSTRSSRSRSIVAAAVLALWFSRAAHAVPSGEAAGFDSVDSLPPIDAVAFARSADDWLLAPAAYRAGVYRTAHPDEIVLTNGLVRRTFRLRPGGATVALDNLMTGASMLRAVKPEAIVEIDGERREVGGLHGQPNHAYLDPEWVDRLEASPQAMPFAGFRIGKAVERCAWKRVRHHAPGAQWPPAGVSLSMEYRMPPATTAPGVAAHPEEPIRVSIHYELYDGIPCFSKWITVHNDTERTIELDRFTSEILALVESSSTVIENAGEPVPAPPLHVETDYTFVAGRGSACAHSVHWVADPEYATQVDYLRRNPCLLEVRPEIGPAWRIAAGESFESFRVFELLYDSTDRERTGLAIRRMYRTVAPWVTENPLMMHVRHADRETVRNAIDQCAAVGFEMVILTFGSGFNIENEDPGYRGALKEYADYARSKGVEIGGYSLLASRRVGGGNDVVMPPGEKPIFGNSPCLQSEWGRDYFRKLYRFYEETGFLLLEHDGSYPGDVCAAGSHPGHRGLDDSRWAQWTMIRDFYVWCRGRGIYLNVPDWYYLAGANKCAMGYRETNWSLPRSQQVVHTRQNIHDGTWDKTPSMGWMFVPLTEYHGGGAAATIEPLNEHLEHYGRMLASNLSMGVQACYRGPRLYDTAETRALVKGWVDRYREYRDILESDVIHGRRADARDIDWMLHVNPRLEHRGLLVAFNPLAREIERTLRVPLYYTGLTDRVLVRQDEGPARATRLARDHTVEVTVRISAGGTAWVVFDSPE